MSAHADVHSDASCTRQKYTTSSGYKRKRHTHISTDNTDLNMVKKKYTHIHRHTKA